MPHIVALFGPTMLSVAPAIPEDAREAAGRVTLVENGTLVLDGEHRYALPPSFDPTCLSRGMEVHLVYIGEATQR